jgi:hypothetical protein
MRHIMSTTTETSMETDQNTQEDGAERLPTVPCSVVWSRGHAYVLELIVNRPRWVGRDDRGRPVEYSCTELQRRGWSRTAD